jgi:transcriptional regulator with XRE-family HTH domain
MSQERLAFATGVDRSYISQLGNDKRSPTLQFPFRLCDALGVSAGVVVTRVDKAGRRQRRGWRALVD